MPIHHHVMGKNGGGATGYAVRSKKLVKSRVGNVRWLPPRPVRPRRSWGRIGLFFSYSIPKKGGGRRWEGGCGSCSVRSIMNRRPT